MLRRYSLLAMLAVALFALSGCYVGTYSSGTNYARVSTARIAYYGPHPVYDTYGSDDWCNVRGVHYHDYAPDSDDFFVRDSGRYVFVGDPTYYVSNVNFDTYYYMGPHPLQIGNNWCYINGPHRHHWAASGYYNYTRVGSVNYYTYYGERNSYYDPNHRHYDLHTYYSNYQPTRYVGTGRTTVGMSQRPANNIRTTSQNPNAVYVAPNASRPNYNYTNNHVRPTTSVARPSTTVVRPGTNNTVYRPVSSSVTVSRPSTSSATVTTVSRPGSNTTVSRPGSTTTVSRPSTTTVSRPSTTTVSRPSTTTVSRPSTTTVSRPSTTTVSRPSTTTVSRPSTTTVSRPSTTTVSRPSTTTVSRPSTTTVSRPSTTTVSRPSSNNTGRVDYPTGKNQYINNSNSSSDDEDENNGSNRRRTRRR